MASYAVSVNPLTTIHTDHSVGENSCGKQLLSTRAGYITQKEGM